MSELRMPATALRSDAVRGVVLVFRLAPVLSLWQDTY